MEGPMGESKGAMESSIGGSTMGGSMSGGSYEARQYYYNARMKMIKSSSFTDGNTSFNSSVFSPSHTSNNNNGNNGGDGSIQDDEQLDLPHNPVSRHSLSSLSPEQHLTLADKFIGGFIAMVIRCEAHINAQHSDLVNANTATR